MLTFFFSFVSIFLESPSSGTGCGSLSRGQTYRLVLSRPLHQPYISAAQINLSEYLPLIRAFASPRSRARDLIKDAFREFADILRLVSFDLQLEEPLCSKC